MRQHGCGLVAVDPQPVSHGLLVVVWPALATRENALHELVLGTLERDGREVELGHCEFVARRKGDEPGRELQNGIPVLLRDQNTWLRYTILLTIHGKR